MTTAATVENSLLPPPPAGEGWGGGMEPRTAPPSQPSPASGGRRSIRTLLVALICSAELVACSSEIELPPAEPLKAAPEQLAKIPHLEAGQFPVAVLAKTDWKASDQSLAIRAVYPDAPGAFPLIVFSHGFASDSDAYDPMLEHWASHGFVVVAPSHPDSGGTARAIWSSIRLGKSGLIAARLEQMQTILDGLESLPDGLRARIDNSKLLAAGHSFGAFTAQQLGGAIAVEPETGETVAGRDQRIQAVVAFSPPGEMFGWINGESWKSLAVPMLATTGTWDVDGRFVTEWRQHALSYETAPPGNKHLLVVQGADHYLGNLICRPEREAEPQTDALRMVNAAAVTFMQAQLAGEPFDLAPQLEVHTNGFALIESR